MASRSGFSSRLGFVAAAAGSAVGLGNIWAFPYVTAKNGGGAFLLVYLILIFLIGYPVMTGEITLGRRTQSNPYGAYLKAKGGGKRWALVGLWGVICGVMILSFYNVIAGWAFGYFIQTSFGDLVAVPDGTSIGHFSERFVNYTASVGDIFLFAFSFMAITAFVVLRGVQKGIESAAKILMPFLFAILIGLIIYALSGEGAAQGLKNYLVPDFSNFTLSTINSALGQAFFSLSLGMGALITYGSYISKQENIPSAAGVVTLADTMVAFLAGLLIIPLIPHEIFISDTVKPGPGLVFETLPLLFSKMGETTGRIVGGSFFLLLCVAALTSTISLLEVPVAYLVDEKKWPRKRAVLVLAAIIFIIGLPSMLSYGAVDALSAEGLGGRAFLDRVADIFLEIGLPLGGLLMSIFIGYRWKTSRMTDEIEEGNPSYRGSFLESFLNFMISYVIPLVLAFIFISTVLSKFFGINII